MRTHRIRRQRRLRKKDAGFPSQTDMDAAIKLARRVDPVLVEFMNAAIYSEFAGKAFIQGKVYERVAR